MGSPPQALVDDTEDVSLDFGSEEELALRKAKIRAGEVESPLIFSKTNCAAECSGIALHTRLNGKG